MEKKPCKYYAELELCKLLFQLMGLLVIYVPVIVLKLAIQNIFLTIALVIILLYLIKG